MFILRHWFSLFCILLTLPAGIYANSPSQQQPNIIFLMADDLGWGDTGFNGSKIAKTPNMDKLAKQGMIFENFYSVGPICSPTRACVQTGRHYLRYGLTMVNGATLQQGEFNIAKASKAKGYTTGHFGKWHLGTLDPNSKIGPHPATSKKRFAPPWLRGYDKSFCTETNIATWDPLDETNLRLPKHRCQFFKDGKKVDGDWKGSSEKIITTQALQFFEDSHKKKQPFMATIWFYGPHTPVRASKELRQAFKKHRLGEQHYLGSITSIDEEIGRIQQKLSQLNIANDTLIFFCSDNGPEGKGVVNIDYDPYKGSAYGKTGGLRGRKRHMHEGGIRVPAFAYWPATIKPGSRTKQRLSTLDYLPTLLDITEQTPPDNRPIDGESFLNVLSGKEWTRKGFIPLGSPSWRSMPHTGGLIKGDYKLLIHSSKENIIQLYDLDKDPGEKNNLADKNKKVTDSLKLEYKEWFKSAKNSFDNGDYQGYKKQGAFINIKF